MNESFRQDPYERLLGRITVERPKEAVDESIRPEWFEQDFVPKVLKVQQLQRILTEQNEAEAPHIYKVTHSNVYCGESGDIKFNGQTYIITPPGIESKNDNGKLVFTSNGVIFENIQASVQLRGGTGEQGQLLDSAFTQPRYLNEYLAKKHNQVVLFPVYPESLQRSIFDKYINEYPEALPFGPKKIYKAISRQSEIGFPRVVGLDDLLWNRMACAFSSIRLVGDEKIHHICGFSTGGGTALLLLENAFEMGLNLKNLKSILAGVPAIEPKTMIDFRGGLRDFFHLYYDTSSEAVLNARTPDVLSLAANYPNVKIYMLQGTNDENLPIDPFMKLMQEVEESAAPNKPKLVLVNGVGHNLVGLKELYNLWNFAMQSK